MSNPLLDLTRQIGVDDRYVARHADIPLAKAQAALADPPTCDAVDYLKCVTAIGGKIRLPAGPGLSFWVETAAVDELLTDPARRMQLGLPSLPETVGELRRLVKGVLRAGMQPAQAAAWLAKGWVPTATGLLSWDSARVQNVSQTGDTGHGDRDPLAFAAESVSAWRTHVMDELLANLVKPDPLFPIRYGMRWQLDGPRFTVRCHTEKLPAIARGWALDGMNRVPWLAGRWGAAELTPAWPPGAGSGTPSTGRPAPPG